MSGPGYTELDSVFDAEQARAFIAELRARAAAETRHTSVFSRRSQIPRERALKVPPPQAARRGRPRAARPTRGRICLPRLIDSAGAPVTLGCGRARDVDDPVDRELLHRARRRIRLGWIVVLAILHGFPTVILVILART